MTFYEDGTKLRPSDPVKAGCYDTCGVGGCPSVVATFVVAPDHAGALLEERTPSARVDIPTYSLRCGVHARQAPGQLDLFGGAA